MLIFGSLFHTRLQLVSSLATYANALLSNRPGHPVFDLSKSILLGLYVRQCFPQLPFNLVFLYRMSASSRLRSGNNLLTVVAIGLRSRAFLR